LSFGVAIYRLLQIEFPTKADFFRQARCVFAYVSLFGLPSEISNSTPLRALRTVSRLARYLAASSVSRISLR
jgi:hypothetical protein